MIRRFQKNHRIILTSRNYREVNQLAKLRKLNLKFVGKHGGVEKYDKLDASTNRIYLLSKIIRNKFRRVCWLNQPTLLQGFKNLVGLLKNSTDNN